MKFKFLSREKNSGNQDCVNFGDIEDVLEEERLDIENRKIELETNIPSIVAENDVLELHKDESVRLEARAEEIEIVSAGLRRVFENRNK